MTAVLRKTSRGREKGLKVATKTRKLQKPEGEKKTAAQETEMMGRGGWGTITAVKGKSRTPTQTQDQIPERSEGETGRQRMKRAQIVLQTDVPQLHRGVVTATLLCLVFCWTSTYLCWRSSSLQHSRHEEGGRGIHHLPLQESGMDFLKNVSQISVLQSHQFLFYSRDKDVKLCNFGPINDKLTICFYSCFLVL